MAVDYLSSYVAAAPLSFALCRAAECKVLAKTPIEPPVLDLGCGDGLFARILFRGKSVEAGIDISTDEVRRASAAGAHKHVVLATGDALPFADRTFKTILSNSVLEHVDNLAGNLSESFRVLEPQGKIIATMPLGQLSECFFYSDVLKRLGAGRAAEQYANWKHRIWRHQNLFDVKGWAFQFEQAGFRIDDLLLFVSQPTARIADLLFPLSPPSLLLKKLFGRMVLRPRFLSNILAQCLRGTYDRDGAGGRIAGTICVVATKASVEQI